MSLLRILGTTQLVYSTLGMAVRQLHFPERQVVHLGVSAILQKYNYSNKYCGQWIKQAWWLQTHTHTYIRTLIIYMLLYKMVPWSNARAAMCKQSREAATYYKIASHNVCALLCPCTTKPKWPISLLFIFSSNSIRIPVGNWCKRNIEKISIIYIYIYMWHPLGTQYMHMDLYKIVFEKITPLII